MIHFAIECISYPYLILYGFSQFYCEKLTFEQVISLLLALSVYMVVDIPELLIIGIW